MPTEIITEPVYQQVAKVLRQALENDGFADGDKFPSERELSEKYRVSRVTINKVISNMVAEGLLEYRTGIGTFVLPRAKALHNSLREMESFTEHVRAFGLVPETRVLAYRQISAHDVPAFVREGLGISEKSSERIIYVQRLRLASNEPVILEDRWLRESLVPGLEKKDLESSFYFALENRLGIELGGERHRIRARNLSEIESDLLGAPENAAGLIVEGPGFAKSGMALWYQVLVHRGDRYELINEVRSAGASPQTTVQLLPAS